MSGTSRVDRRSLHSPLAGVLAKLEIDTDRARRILGQATRLAIASLDMAAEQQRRASGAQASTARMAVDRIEPAGYALALAHLVVLRNHCDAQREQQRSLDADVRNAAQACAALHRRIDAMQGLLRRAEQQHDGALLRRRCREDDLAWLARCGARTDPVLGEWSAL